MSDSTDLPARHRKAFVISSIVVIAVVAVLLGYSVIRDPGPQPTVPPTISGTDDRALKRAIVHYVGALESRNPKAIERLAGDIYVPELVSFRAKAAVEDFGDAAQKPTTVKVTPDGISSETMFAAITFEDGRTQNVEFGRTGSTWRPLPLTSRKDPVLPTPAGEPIPSASGR